MRIAKLVSPAVRVASATEPLHFDASAVDPKGFLETDPEWHPLTPDVAHAALEPARASGQG